MKNSKRDLLTVKTAAKSVRDPCALSIKKKKYTGCVGCAITNFACIHVVFCSAPVVRRTAMENKSNYQYYARTVTEWASQLTTHNAIVHFRKSEEEYLI